MEFYLPKPFEQRMRQQLGTEFDLYLKSLKEPAPVSVRINRAKNADAASADVVGWENDGFYLSERPVFTLDPLFHAGMYYVQEACSMFAGYAVKTLLGDNVSNSAILDLCAAPGGKSTHYASMIGDNGLLVCNEVIGSRVPILQENLAKWGRPNVIITKSDPSGFGKLGGFFDVVAIDAPCSGEGLFRRDYSAMDEWSVENAELCAQRQRRIIADAWNCIKPGGYLVYSTCTFNPNEDELNMDWIAQNYDAENVQLPINEKWGICKIEYNGLQGYRFIHYKTKGEGFFLCVFRKKDGDVANWQKGKVKKHLQHAPQALIKQTTPMLIGNFEFYLNNDEIRAIPASIDKQYQYLCDKLHVVGAGIETAKVFGNKLQPQHELAMSNNINRQYFNTIDLNLNDALKYLHRDAIFVEGAKQGINLVTYKNTPLGWVKNLGTRWNNLYPQNWKIRMNLP